MENLSPLTSLSNSWAALWRCLTYGSGLSLEPLLASPFPPHLFPSGLTHYGINCWVPSAHIYLLLLMEVLGHFFTPQSLPVRDLPPGKQAHGSGHLCLPQLAEISRLRLSVSFYLMFLFLVFNMNLREGRQRTI